VEVHAIIQVLVVHNFYLIRGTLKLDIHSLKQEAMSCEEVPVICDQDQQWHRRAISKQNQEWKEERIITVLLITVYEASIVSFPDNIFNALALNFITFTAFSFGCREVTLNLHLFQIIAKIKKSLGLWLESQALSSDFMVTPVQIA
jgi:hypothetical protein